MKMKKRVKGFFAGEEQMKNRDLTTREASAVLGVSIRQILTLLYEGKLPGNKVGMVWQIPASAIEQRLKSRKARNG